MKHRIIDLTKTFIMSEEGQTMVEYALILAILAIGILATLYALGDSIRSILYDGIINTLDKAIGKSTDLELGEQIP